jgi:ABC-2 type transport system permease protein
VLFGLLAAYIINLRHFSQQLTNPFWVDLVSYLNLGACSLNLATLTTRFVYPQFSLEGKRVWIVGMAPLGLMRVVTTKYLLATVCSLAITITLVWGSCHMLRLPFERTLFFSYSVFIMTLALNGLAMGLGVLYPNFREDNPSKIVSGFGGTFCLVISFLYILASVAALAIGAPWARAGTQSIPVIIASLAAFAVISLLVGYLPLKLGLRKVATLEL